MYIPVALLSHAHTHLPFSITAGCYTHLWISLQPSLSKQAVLHTHLWIHLLLTQLSPTRYTNSCMNVLSHANTHLKIFIHCSLSSQVHVTYPPLPSPTSVLNTTHTVSWALYWLIHHPLHPLHTQTSWLFLLSPPHTGGPWVRKEEANQKLRLIHLDQLCKADNTHLH